MDHDKTRTIPTADELALVPTIELTNALLARADNMVIVWADRKTRRLQLTGRRNNLRGDFDSKTMASHGITMLKKCLAALTQHGEARRIYPE